MLCNPGKHHIIAVYRGRLMGRLQAEGGKCTQQTEQKQSRGGCAGTYGSGFEKDEKLW